jgi:hypothetical protein
MKNKRPTTPAMASTPITTGAAMAAIGTDLLELTEETGVLKEDEEGEGVEDEGVEDEAVEDEVAVMMRVAGAVEFCWSDRLSVRVGWL